MAKDEENKGSDSASVRIGEINDIDSGYERYLQLHDQFRKDGGFAHRKLLRKLDFRLLPTLGFLYLMCSLDRSNAGNAKLFGLLEDIGMTSEQFNLALMYLFFTYGLFEPVSNIILRRLGPKRWFPFIVTAWGLVTTLTCLVSSYGGYVAIRLVLGMAEAGLYPGSYFILSMWYTPKELATRMSIFYGANTAAGAFGGVIAYAVGNLDGAYGMRAWKWLFLIEGVITVAAGLSCLVFLPNFPHQQNPSRKSKWQWLTPSELEYAQLRIKYASSPNPPTYDFRWSDVTSALRDPKTYFMMSLFCWGGSLPTYSLSYTLPTMVKNLGYSAVRAQALTTPPYIFATFICILIGWLSDRYQARFAALMSCYILGLIGILILWITTHYPHLAGVSYFAIFLAAAGYSSQAPILAAWAANNLPNPSKRAAAFGIFMLVGSVGGGSIGTNIYLDSEAPTYPLGFGFSVGCTVLGAMGPAAVHWWLMRRENRRRERIEGEEIRGKYTPQELSDLGELSPGFRYTL